MTRKEVNKVLIVDDDPAILETLSSLVQAFKFSATPCNDAKKAITLIKNESYDTVLTDIRMHDVTGFELLDEIKSINPDVPVILMTGYAELDTAISAIKRGAFDFITKPFNPEYLIQSIQKAVKYYSLVRMEKNYKSELEDEISIKTEELESTVKSLQKEIVERKKMGEELRESEERYRRITDAITDYIYTVRMEDDKPSETVHSEACVAVTGYTTKEFAADTYLWINIVAEEDKDLVRRHAEQVYSLKHPQSIEHRLIRKDNIISWVENTIVPRFDQKGKLISYDGIVRDITERKMAEKELSDYHDHLEDLVKERTAVLEDTQKAQVVLLDDMKMAKDELFQANLQLKELDLLKSMFIASMSHELRTPLNSVIGFSSVMLKEIPGPLNDEQKKQLTLVKKSANHLLDLINEIIDISKVEAGRIDVAAKEFNLSEIIMEIRDSFKFAAQEQGNNLILHMPNEFTIESDEQRIKQILVNLVGNAVKFTVNGEIVIKLDRSNGAAMVSVKDTGIGISEQDMDRLFKPFSQIPGQDRSNRGTGLGLYLSKKIAGILGGDISVHSGTSKGSVFSFSMPLKYQEAKK